MTDRITLLVLSDIHYASELEKARGEFELAAIDRPLIRLAIKVFRHYIWMRHPLAHNHLLEMFLQQAGSPNLVVANGDYSCDSRFVGVSDDAAFASVCECLSQLRRRFAGRFHANFGDHELGKKSLSGGKGGMRLASWHRALAELEMRPFWQMTLGNYVLLGVVSSLLALPLFEPDTLPEERAEWARLRSAHLVEIQQAFAALQPEQRVVLFCHDPSALPFLWREEMVRAKLPQIEQTFIGHLHSNLVLWKCRMLSGMPTIRFLGHAIRRMSAALNEAHYWKPFRVRLCPSLAGIELLKDGGFWEVELDAQARAPARYRWQRLIS